MANVFLRLPNIHTDASGPINWIINLIHVVYFTLLILLCHFYQLFSFKHHHSPGSIWASVYKQFVSFHEFNLKKGLLCTQMTQLEEHLNLCVHFFRCLLSLRWTICREKNPGSSWFTHPKLSLFHCRTIFGHNCSSWFTIWTFFCSKRSRVVNYYSVFSLCLCLPI